ncbi:methyltransferase family protein [Dyadobacter sp.]|uniref:methyltransferase family protein n=1 Tax=Dyadobacter sp. TaxID=1914288 RepID=UPI003F721A67
MKKTKDILFVAAQLVLFGLYAIAPSIILFPVNRALKFAGILTSTSGVVIILVSIFQIRRSLTPFPSPVKSGKLITTGLYGYIRHPIYSGIILAAAGYGVQAGDISKIAITLLLILLFYFKSQYEEKMLMAFYNDYKQYRSHTYRFFPFL